MARRLVTSSKSIAELFLAYEGDSLTYHPGQKFSTYDQDFRGHNAMIRNGAWWSPV